MKHIEPCYGRLLKDSTNRGLSPCGGGTCCLSVCSAAASSRSAPASCRRAGPSRSRASMPAPTRRQEFRGVIERIDDSFRRQWTEQGIQPAQPAPDLAVARRAALGLMGTIPSLEEIRQFEYLPSEQRLPWWIDHILQDRRYRRQLRRALRRGPSSAPRTGRSSSTVVVASWPGSATSSRRIGPTTSSSAN